MQLKKKKEISLYKTEKQKWLVGLLTIVLIYTFYYLYFQDSPNTATINRRIRHVIKFGTTFLVYLVGTIHLGKLKDEWMNILWHFIHISGLFLLVSIGLYDWLLGMVSLPVKLFAASIQEFLISPVLYFAMGLINKKMNK